MPGLQADDGYLACRLMMGASAAGRRQVPGLQADDGYLACRLTTGAWVAGRRRVPGLQADVITDTGCFQTPYRFLSLFLNAETLWSENFLIYIR